MGQIPFTLKYKIKKPNKLGEVLIYIRYYSSVHDILVPTPVRIHKDLFLPGKLKSPVSKSHPNHEALNRKLDRMKLDIENRVTEWPGDINIDFLMGNTASSDLITAFIGNLGKELTGKLSTGTLRHYVVIKNKVESFDPKATFKSISLDWMQRFEKSIRDKVGSGNTVNANMKKFKAILNKAADLDMLDKKQFERYSNPVYIEDLPVYLEEQEIESFYRVAQSAGDGPAKTSAYYFLLGCYTGYRMSDLHRFNYEEKVKGKTIVLRAKKNKSIVSIPIFPRLKEILSFCKDNPLDVSEKEMRLKVKSIAKIAGIKADVRIHSARHSFAMLMLEKGLSVDEVAELLGDSKDVAKRYARITNKHLHKRVMDVMK